MKYRLLEGKKYYLGGKLLDAGSEVELTDAQFAGLSDRFEPVAGATASAPAAPAADTAGVLGLDDLSWDKAAAKVSKLDTADALDGAETEEKAGKDRKGVHEAIEARRAELEG